VEHVPWAEAGKSDYMADTFVVVTAGD